MTTSLKKYAFAAFLATAAAITAHAQSIFSNTITGTRPNASNPYTTGQVVDPYLTVSGIGRSSVLNGNDTIANEYSAGNWTASFDETRYFTFTLTPAPGYELNLTSFVFNSSNNGMGPQQSSLRISVDGFANDLDNFTYLGGSIDLGSSDYQHLTGPVEFRLYGYGGAGGSGSYFRVSDFTFNGTLVASAVPEPSTYAVIFGSVALAGAIWYRRRPTKSPAVAA